VKMCLIFFAYLHGSFHLMLSIWFENFDLISHMGKIKSYQIKGGYKAQCWLN